MVTIYGPRALTDRGGTVAFNLRDRGGRWIPFWSAEQDARAAGIALRGGCFCNPGAAQAALGLDGQESDRCLAALAGEFTPQRFSACLETPVGALRLSLGLANHERDVERALAWVAACADSYRARATASTKPATSSGVTTQRSSLASTSTALRRSLA
jgi:selenocysteine lyase/cysteine desulfurase